MKAETHEIPPRSPLAGVIDIFRYNAPMYIGTLLSIIVAAILLQKVPLPVFAKGILITFVSLSSFWFFSSLLMSYYVYDVSPFYRWEWIPARLPKVPDSWVNIHAGLDEVTRSLRKLFPDSGYKILDIYDSQTMTEPSIARARQLQTSSEPSISSSVDKLPLDDNSVDTIFLIFAAHEVRQPERRLQLFQELYRSLRPGGYVLIVEHLRDWRNALAFGPGFMHFHNRSEWRRVSVQSGLKIQTEWVMAMLVTGFLLQKPSA